MADLEEMGLIFQPHTSSGRIPSDKGYRLYVDALMDEKIAEVEEMREQLLEKADKMESLLKQVAKLLAINTNYATMVMAPRYRTPKVKFIQLTYVDENQPLAIIVLEGNTVKNRILPVYEVLEQDVLLRLNLLLNTFLQGLDLAEINLSLIQKMKEQAEGHGKIISDVLEAIAEAIGEEDEIKIYTSGATNILKYPELSDAGKASELLYTIEEKKQLNDLMNSELNNGENRGIQVYIGDETPVDSMKDCAVVTAVYQIEEGVYGRMGIIGPKRMDYEKVVATLQKLMTDLDYIFKDRK